MYWEPYAGKLHVRFLEEFISNCLIIREGENLLMRSPSQIKKTNVASYVESVEQTLKWKASDLLDDFYKMVKESHVRGTSEFVKNKCRRV